LLLFPKSGKFAGLEELKMFLQLTAQDIADLKRFENMLTVLGSHKVNLVEVRAIKHTGDKALTAVVQLLSARLGLTQKNIRHMLGKPYYPSFADKRYVIRSKGGDVPLRMFKARETRKGVSAAPFGERKVFEGSFIKGGIFPARKQLSMGGNVFEREGSARLGIAKVESGVILPVEIMTNETTQVFDSVVDKELPARTLYEINRVSGGMFS
jgi:hypothetical protein